MHTPGDDLRHVAVLIGDCERYGAASPFGIHLFLDGAESLFPLLETVCVVIPDDIPENGLSHIPFHISEVIKALISVCIPGSFSGRQQAVDLHGDKGGIDHDILGGSGMDVHAGDPELGFGRIEILILDLTLCIAIESIGEVSAECLEIKVCGSHSDLLVRSKRDADRPMRNLILHDPLRHGHDLGDSGFVVRAQDGGPVACDQSAAFQ